MDQDEKNAREEALSWLSLYLSDKDYLDELLWGNYVEGGLEVHPSRSEVDVLVPKVRDALLQHQPLPEMDPDVKWAFAEYLAGWDQTIVTSETANNDTDDEEWPNAILEAWIELRQPLLLDEPTPAKEGKKEIYE